MRRHHVCRPFLVSQTRPASGLTECAPRCRPGRVCRWSGAIQSPPFDVALPCGRPPVEEHVVSQPSSRQKVFWTSFIAWAARAAATSASPPGVLPAPFLAAGLGLPRCGVAGGVPRFVRVPWPGLLAPALIFLRAPCGRCRIDFGAVLAGMLGLAPGILTPTYRDRSTYGTGPSRPHITLLTAPS